MRPIEKKTEVSNPMVQLSLYIDNRNKLNLIVGIAQKIAEQNFESQKISSLLKRNLFMVIISAGAGASTGPGLGRIYRQVWP